MLLHQYDLSTPNFGKRYEVASDARSLLFSVIYNGRPVVYDTNLFTRCMDDLRAAINGKISLSYVANRQQAITQIPNKLLVDMAEVYATADNSKISFTRIATGPGSSGNATDRWKADFEIPISMFGTVRLNQDAKCILEFEGFTDMLVPTNGIVSGSAVITVDSYVSAEISNVIQTLKSFNCQPNAVTNINVSTTGVLIVPKDMVGASLHSYEGLTSEIKAASLDTYIRQKTREHLLADGFIEFYDKYFGLDVTGFRDGTLQLASSIEAYGIENIRL